jgi:Domain of unknown function (DUF4249)
MKANLTNSNSMQILDLRQVLNLLLLLLIGFSSCELKREKEFVVPFEGKKLVAIGLINVDKGVEVFVTSTVPLISGKQDSLKEVVVNLFENDVSINELKKDSGLFKTPSNLKIQDNKTYRIEVKATDYTPLSTNALKLPFPTKIEQIDWHFKDSSKERIELNTLFNDAMGKNYYAIKIERYYGDTLFQETSPERYRFIGPYDVFNDELFDNKQAKITREVYAFDYRHKINRLKIRLYSLDEATYSFFKTIDTQDFVKGEYFLEPTKVYSNIKNGYGVWGAYSSSTIDIRF